MTRARDLRLRIGQWSPGIKVPTTIGQIRSAQRQAREGQFSQASEIVESMLSDDAYCAALSSAVDAIVGAPVVMAPVTGADGEPVAASKRLADKLSAEWGAVVPEDEAASFIAWYLGLGVAVGTIDWVPGRTKWVAKFRCLHPRALSWHSGDDTYRFQARDKEYVVTPGDGKWVLWGSRDSWQRSALAALGETWFGKRVTMRDWLRYNERHGLPILLAKIPGFIPDEEQASFIDDLGALGSDTTLALPTHLNQEGAAFDAELLEPEDQAWQTFKDSLERFDRKFQVYFSGSNAGSELVGNVGSRAASESSSDGSKDLAAHRARRFSNVLRDQLVVPMVDWLYGKPAELCPTPVYQVTKPDESEKFEAWSGLAGVASAWKLAGYEITNIPDLAAKMGLQIEEAEPVEPNDKPGQPGQSSDKPGQPNGGASDGSSDAE